MADERTAMDRLIGTLDGGVLLASTGHAQLKADLLTAARSYAAERALLTEGVDFAVVTQLWVARFKELAEEEAPWHFPIGSDKYPVELWYIATKHLEKGTLWNGGVHTGVDWNVEVMPRGDIDRGQPTWAVTDGVIHGTWYSDACLGSVVYKVMHNGLPLWVRHWHMAKDALFLSWQAGMEVKSGQELAHIGDYAGGDHLHFDMCVEAFHPGVWWTAMSGATNEEKLARWLDPVIVLKAHLDPALVDAALRIG
jgi:hypothetical protein